MEFDNSIFSIKEELLLAANTRAAFCSLLNAHFITLPDSDFVEHIQSADYILALESLTEDKTRQNDFFTGASLMLGYIRSTFSLDVAELAGMLGVERTRLYRGVTPGYSPPPPFEAVWSTNNNVSEVLQNLSGAYRIAGMTIVAEAKERLDYIGVQLDFLRQLALREVNDIQVGDEAGARISLERQATFLSEHLGQWLPLFIDKALEIANNDFYRGHLLMLRGFIAYEREQMKLLLLNT